METLYIVLLSLSFCLIGYLLGSIIFGIIISKVFYKKDVRQYNSKNPGATNMYRTCGKWAGLSVALLDASKSMLSVLISWVIYCLVLKPINDNSNLVVLVYLSGLFAAIGHCYPIYYIYKLFRTRFNFAECKKYQGGKAVSTMGGFTFIISPWLGLTALLSWILIIAITRYVSLASMSAAILTTFMALLPQVDYLALFNNTVLYHETLTVSYSSHLGIIIGLFAILLLMSLLLIYRHKNNIKALLNKSERKIF